MSTTIKKRQMIKVTGVNDLEIAHPETQANQVLFTGTNNVSTPKTINGTSCANVDDAIDSLVTALEQAGKVDDVKVDGTSVVTNKVANIPLSTAITNALDGLDSSVTADSGYALASVTQTNGKLSAKTQVKIPNTPSEVGLGNVTNDKQMKAFSSTPTADKIVITKSSVNELGVSSYSVADVVAIAEGKTASYVTSGTQMSTLKVQTASVTVTSFKDIDGTTIPIGNFKIGDVILITDTDYPDRWVSATTSTSITLSKMETAKVDLSSYYTKTESDNKFQPINTFSATTDRLIKFNSSGVITNSGISDTESSTSHIYDFRNSAGDTHLEITCPPTSTTAVTHIKANKTLKLEGNNGDGASILVGATSVKLTNDTTVEGNLNMTGDIVKSSSSVVAKIGNSSNKWNEIHGITIKGDTLYENGTSLADKYQPLDADLTSIAGLTGTSGLLKKTASNTWALDTNQYLTGNQNITVSGDASGNGTTAIGLTLASIMPNVDTTGQYSAVKVDTKGRVTAVGKAIEWGTTTSSTPSDDLMDGGIFMALQG